MSLTIMNNNKRKIVRSTAAQLRVLVDYMSTNPLFAAGQYTGPLGAQQIDKEWLALTQTLANVGPTKSVEQWKHTWRDLKKRAREEGSKVRRASATTGNSVPVPELTEQTKKILDTIGHESATGIGGEEETGVGGNLDPMIPPPPPPEYSEIVKIGNTGAGPSNACAGPPSPRASKRRRSKAALTRGDIPRLPSMATSNAAVFIKTQQETNKLLDDIKMELKESNRLREKQVKLLAALLDKNDGSETSE